VAPPSRSPARRASRLNALDSLRFVAAAGVVGYHFTNTAAWDGHVAPGKLGVLSGWLAYGALGVPLFFVISGFVVLMSAWGRDLPHFVASRVGRLFPAYWVAVVISLVIVFVIRPGGAVPPTKSDALLNLTMVQNVNTPVNLDPVYWTLWCEARFYLLLGVLMLIGITRQRVLAFAALWPVLASLASLTGSDLLSQLLMPGYSSYFAGGMLLFLLYRDGHDVLTWLLLGMNSLFALDMATQHYSAWLPETTGLPVSTHAIALGSFACFGLVALVTLTRIRHLDARWMTALGALTYPLYLIHNMLGRWIIHEVAPRLGPWAAVALAVLCALAAAAILHHAVEKPLGARLRAAVLHALRRETDGERPPAPSPAQPAPAQFSVPTARHHTGSHHYGRGDRSARQPSPHH
jgi:peptidoglycan/LPS O-acetylase OafA/YrhL